MPEGRKTGTVTTKSILDSGDIGALMGLLDRFKARKSCPKYVNAALTKIQSCQNAIEPLPVYGNELVRTVDGIDFSVAELSLKGVGSVRVSSNQIADRVGASRHTVSQLIERNAKFLNKYGLMSTVLSARSDGRPGRGQKSYMLNQGQTIDVIMSLQTDSAREFRVVFVKAFQALLEFYLINQPKFEVVKRENLGTGIYDQFQEEKAAHKITAQERDYYKHRCNPEAFAEGAFEANQTKRPPSKRCGGGRHVKTIARTIVNSVVQ
jgi:phage regulator Rha-like protein